MNKTLLEVVGWAGVAAVLAAYSLTSLGVVSPNDVMTILLNLFGGAGLALVSLRQKAYQPLALNVVWTAVAVIALVRALL
jgi:hypothetical protein